jgi:phosphatidylethanolamine-binding protein (PEBP) family uncharacterized protein
MAETETIKAILASEVPALSISFGETEVKEAGYYLSRQLAQEAPKISFPGATAGKKYIVLSIDLDAPFISFPILGPILHWVRSDLSTTSSASTSSSPQEGVLESETSTLVPWGPPGPPPGAAPHRYVFCLYEQPEGLTPDMVIPGGEMKSRYQRMRFDFAGFEKKAGVGKVVAGGWFTSN